MWDVEISLCGCGLPLPDVLEDSVLGRLGEMIVRSFNHVNRIAHFWLERASESSAANRIFSRAAMLVHHAPRSLLTNARARMPPFSSPSAGASLRPCPPNVFPAVINVDLSGALDDEEHSLDDGQRPASRRRQTKLAARGQPSAKVESDELTEVRAAVQQPRLRH